MRPGAQPQLLGKLPAETTVSLPRFPPAGSSASLAARLFRPVQRMCVYPLLFRELLKHGQEKPRGREAPGQSGAPHAEAEETAIVDAHRAALHRAMIAVHAVVMQVNEEVRKLETQLQLLQLLVSSHSDPQTLRLIASQPLYPSQASSLLSPRFSFQRDLGEVVRRETRVLLHEAMVSMRQTQPRALSAKLHLRLPKLKETT